ncbi:alpha/beta hydrolase [Mesorhizobium sp. M7A.F.Ca.CA.001.08.2.1]|nr:alpha/beta hydrolase [Mesorhizobium sp. M7A.F.Ca.CA.001.13.1.1]RUZ06995.1 alpha/beta hydrolase [Mesorhizobium sp. M7A.F.Ca.CA.001.04.2.1]RUZ17857.1 alpha/beta hydrolase [Mesorhizobium sp. M7A.F.Ca.CA.001.09.1.1]RUZ28600.1 alpha/beta hydrolase [Mesorhizobium sp. M7A.F.Ca.CA.001.15.1.1]RUZ33364.1 alpha/beta hydrolase [Mesorhizobium sp. M7A.F.Ca.CA.001.04.1.1]RUZ85446.1 alpha/beta hydrolase [Mesorhizobium sp. M7A.F.Ca.CA.001.14.1.1]RVA69193.1 alpha/beta hydrolase [Mesorhizobium sp. M7A.F.Ca.C
MMFDGFQSAEIDTGDANIFCLRAGGGPPLLLLHGFPQTHLMWRDIAPALASRFSVVCADLRGYGRSSCPASIPDHAPYAKRAMAADMTRLMEKLGFSSFMVAGHDRGGRVAYRMALDHPGSIDRLAVLDIVPTADAWDRADARLALGYWPWSLLAQPEPLPEKILSGTAEAIVDNALDGWGSSSSAFPAEVRQAYVDALRAPAHIHAICEEYRAAATLDREHDHADKAAGRRIRCPLLALWSGQGALADWYAGEGGPLALWRGWADDVRGQPMPGGHFFPEENPPRTADLLAGFFSETGHGISPRSELPSPSL